LCYNSFFYISFDLIEFSTFAVENGKIKAFIRISNIDIVLVNSAAGVIVGGKAGDFKDALEIARESISSGAAYAKLKALIKASGGTLQKLEEMEQKHE